MRIVILMACLWLATPPLWGKTVFYFDRDANYEIYTMNADGSNQTRLAFNQAGDFAPAWSPNGRQIVFASFRDDEHLAEIYVMDTDGSNQRRLTHPHGWDGDPDWSPDGSQIAFNSDRNSGRADLNIFVMDADGGNVRQVTDTLVAQRPKWSPDGEWILLWRTTFLPFVPMARTSGVFLNRSRIQGAMWAGGRQEGKTTATSSGAYKFQNVLPRGFHIKFTVGNTLFYENFDEFQEYNLDGTLNQPLNMAARGLG